MNTNDAFVDVIQDVFFGVNIHEGGTSTHKWLHKPTNVIWKEFFYLIYQFVFVTDVK